MSINDELDIVLSNLNQGKVTPVKDKLFIKKPVENIVVQENEVIKYNVKDYISGSYLTFEGNMTRIDKQGEIIKIGDVISLTDSYNYLTSINVGWTEYTNPLHDSYALFHWKDKIKGELTFLLFVNECYKAMLFDFTNRDNKKITLLTSVDLLPIIANYAGFQTIKDLFWNEIITVGSDQTLMLPWSGKGKNFVLWFLISRTSQRVSFDVFARTSKAVQVDKIGRNALGMFNQNSFVYLLSSSITNKTSLTFSRLDLSQIQSKYVGEDVIAVYTSSDFSVKSQDGSYDKYLPKIFNIRDIKIYSIVPVDSKSKAMSHNIIISWYNNGILFLQAQRPEIHLLEVRI